MKIFTPITIYNRTLKTAIINFMSNTFRNNFFIPKPIPKPLGRWRIEQCAIQLNKKIDLSNEDHCGPCGQYALDKQKEET